MTGDTHRDPLEGCETREEYLQRFEEILQREIEVSGHVARYFEARSKGQSKEQAAAVLPEPDSALGQRAKELSLVVDLIMEAHEVEAAQTAEASVRSGD